MIVISNAPKLVQSQGESGLPLTLDKENSGWQIEDSEWLVKVRNY
jgi:hypothetical protein